jgi:pimeloyl-ACP methyl ester carboxylesterase
MPDYIQHNRVRLALHCLRAGSGRTLLLLHGLGERSPLQVTSELAAWPGPVYALDFTGHGNSSVPAGGGYSCEILVADVDAALARLGEVSLVGRGLGGYVALLSAGSRPSIVRGAVICDGPGLHGGGAIWTTSSLPIVDESQPVPPDPFALVELSHEVRPVEYARVFARQAKQFSGLTRPLAICTRERPAWLAAVVDELGLEVGSLEDALGLYARDGLTLR